MTRECPRSAEVAAALAAPGLGADVDESVRHHVAECDSCADLALVMTSFGAERARARRDAVVPSAGLVWWRAQLRRRQQAERAAAAPVAVVQLAALVGALVLTGLLGWWAFAGPARPAFSFDLGALAGALVRSVGEGSALVRFSLAAVVTAWLVVTPVAVYLALRED